MEIDPKPNAPTKRKRKYFTDNMGDAMMAVARFNIGYGQASVMCTAMAKDLGRTDVKVTKKKIRSQLEASCKAEIKRLNEIALRSK